MQNIADHNILNMVLCCLLDEINGPAASLENERDFLFQKNLLKSSMFCLGCNAAMSLSQMLFFSTQDTGHSKILVKI